VNPLPFISAGLGLAGSLIPQKKFDPSGLIRDYVNARPGGYITDEEYAQANRGRSRAANIAGARARLAKDDATWRFNATPGGGFAPSLQRTFGRINAQEGAAAEDANNAESDWLFKSKESNKGFQRHQLDTAFGANLGAARLNFESDAAKKAAFWNSLGDVASLAVGHFGGSQGGGVPGGTMSHTGSGDQWDMTNADNFGGAAVGSW